MPQFVEEVQQDSCMGRSRLLEPDSGEASTTKAPTIRYVQIPKRGVSWPEERPETIAGVSRGRRRQPGYQLTDGLRFQLGDCSLSGFDNRFKFAKIRPRIVIQQLAEARQSLRRLEFNQSIDGENPHACMSIT